MSSLSLLNSSEVMPFLTLTAVFLFIGPVLIMGIATMWMILKQKISNEISARDIKFNASITEEVTKIKNEINTKIADDLSSRDGSITAEIKRILNTKIANELSARLFEVNSTFTAELVRNNNELNKKLTAEIAKINSRDAGYVSEAQNILSMINDIEEDCRNDFGKISSEFNSVRASIEALRNEMIQRYAIAQRLQVEFDQQSVSNESEANSTNESETNSRGSSTNLSSSSSGSSGKIKTQ
jgi:sRNA-binding carbon storage regulator CsrA